MIVGMEPRVSCSTTELYPKPFLKFVLGQGLGTLPKQALIPYSFSLSLPAGYRFVPLRPVTIFEDTVVSFACIRQFFLQSPWHFYCAKPLSIASFTGTYSANPSLDLGCILLPSLSSVVLFAAVCFSFLCRTRFWPFPPPTNACKASFPQCSLTLIER